MGDRMTTTTLPQSATRPRWRFQYSLRSLLLFMLVAGCFSGWVGIKLRAAANKQEIVSNVQRWGGEVYYANQFDDSACFSPEQKTDHPKWFESVFGNSLEDVYAIDLYRLCSRVMVTTDDNSFVLVPHFNISNANFSLLSNFPNLRRLDFGLTGISDTAFGTIPNLEKLEVLNLYGTHVSDQGLEHVKSWTHLKKLYVANTDITAEGVKRLWEALPHCEIDDHSNLFGTWHVP
jgi:hypothetical protein